jgi:hypothetical protein
VVSVASPVHPRFLSRAPIFVFSISGLVFLAGAVFAFYWFRVSGGGFNLFFAIYFALFGGWLVSIFPGRRRPVLEITSGEIRYGTAFLPWRHSVRIEDVVEAEKPKRFPIVLPLRLRSGKRIWLPLGEIRTSERAAALEAVRLTVAQDGEE